MLKLKTNRKLFRYNLLLAFSGIFLFVSCNQTQYNSTLAGSGIATAKFGDSTVTYSFTIGGGTYSPNGANVLSFYNNIYSPQAFNSDFTINTNPGFVGTYNLSINNSAYNSSVFISGILAAKNDFHYSTDSTHTGIITINSYNPQLQTISGTFHFTVVLYNSVEHPIPGDTLVVSKGNFLANIQINYIEQE